ncbi:MAG: TraR/DksA family transcriptional regulator [Candidatus Spechtbacterales bacterium]
MNKKDIEKFNKALKEKKLELAEELKSFASENPHIEGDWESKFPDFDTEGFDIEDAPDEVEEYINRLPVEHVLELRLKAVNDALERIDKGSYGICANCNEEIPEKRLEAMPEANICLECSKKGTKS